MIIGRKVKRKIDIIGKGNLECVGHAKILLYITIGKTSKITIEYG